MMTPSAQMSVLTPTSRARIGGVCADYGVAAAANDGYTGSVGTQTTELPLRGGISGSHLGATDVAMCPAGTVVVGLSGYWGTSLNGGGYTHIRQLTLACSALNPNGNEVTGVTLDLGADQSSNDVGCANGQCGPSPNTFDKQLCPGGMVANGVASSFGEIVDRFGIRCAVPTPAWETP